MPLERRRALARMLADLLGAAREAGEAVEEAKKTVVKAVEEAVGVPLTPESRELRRLYDLTPPPQPGLEELRRLIAESLGLSGEEAEGLDVLELLKRTAPGGNSPEPPGARGEGPTRGGGEAGGEG